MSAFTPQSGMASSDWWYRPIKTRRRRRAFVIYNWTLLLSLFPYYLTLAIRNRPVEWYSWQEIWWVFLLATSFGGLRYGGPIKKFENPKLGSDADYVLYKSMHPTPWKQRGMPAWANDEFDLQRRNQAHYSAYRILRWIFPVCGIGLWLLSRDPATSLWAVRILEAALVPSVLAFLWLPQTIILWTEPDWKEETASGPKLVEASAPRE
jgi:hypothetical protein